MEISAQLVKDLREKTGAGMMECKTALVEAYGDMEKAVKYLREKGIAKAEKKLVRKTTEGLAYSYIHQGGKLGVLVEVNCESDFVARTQEFQDFCKEVAMQIAAANPFFVKRDNIPESVLEKEKEIYRTQALATGKPEKVIDKIIEGKMEKYYQEVCLMEQVYIRDQETKFERILLEKIAKLGENIEIRRFARFKVGEEL